MSDARERIADVIGDVAESAFAGGMDAEAAYRDGEDSPDYRNDKNAATDHIIAIVRDTMLTDAAIEAAARVLYRHHPALIWHTPTESTALPWDDTAGEDRAGKCRLARRQLEAVLAAIIAPAGDGTG